jgi:hypothetical protein
MTRETIEQQRQDMAEQHDRMTGLFVALCIGAANGALIALVFLF